MAVRQGDTNENKPEKTGELRPSADVGRGPAAEGTGTHTMAGAPGKGAESAVVARLRIEAAVEAVRAELEQSWLGLAKQLQQCERQYLQKVEALVLGVPWGGGPEQTAYIERSQAELETAGREARAAADQAVQAYLLVLGRQLTSGSRDRRLLLAAAASLEQMAFDVRVC